MKHALLLTRNDIGIGLSVLRAVMGAQCVTYRVMRQWDVKRSGSSGLSFLRWYYLPEAEIPPCTYKG